MKNFIESFAKFFLYRLGFNVERNVSKQEIENFIKKFNQNYVSVNLVRIGGKNDGGYLIPDIIDKINYCFSAGVGDLSSFEKELSEAYNIKSFMADASVDRPPIQNKNFNFIKKYLSSSSDKNLITLSDWLTKSLREIDENLILQMDIESSEYEVLTFETEKTLSKFSIMVIEFHKFQNLCNPIFLKITKSIFEKIYKKFYICHVHPNNFSGLYKFKGLQIPSCLEITFIRKDLYELCRSNNPVKLPHKLDTDNDIKIKKLNMPEIWWKK
tara:strand:+ start:254 stop:1063 length:810 start_codon:yes stop_codon:yes gene_type:complete